MLLPEQAQGVAGVVPAPTPDPDSPGARLARDNQAKVDAEADPSGPKHCTICGGQLRGDVELAQGSFDPKTGEQDLEGQELTGGGPGNVAILVCPNGEHETWRKVHGSWDREDTRGSRDKTEGRTADSDS